MIRQSALVLLNKGDDSTDIPITGWLSTGSWRDALTGEEIYVRTDDPSLLVSVPAHGVRVLLFDAAVNNVQLMEELDRLQAAGQRAR